ncbi:N-6 DNA methylase [Bacillus thuringiensis]|uniref:N-6 DNA methylase n=1 Tax=Bacillus thuringiensis TaxID=1428 RepID=UPI000BF9A963|nr:N-6 DNA methylase [Bacillus thuringiensis]PES34151.1 DNA methyltransferase [Bacillus thuringiensis]
MKNIKSLARAVVSNVGEKLRGTLVFDEHKHLIVRIAGIEFLLLNKGHGYNIPENITWQSLINSPTNLSNRLNEFSVTVESLNTQLEAVFTSFDFSKVDNVTLYEVISIINKYSLNDEQFNDTDATGLYIDTIFDESALREGRMGGEHFTPEGINELMIHLLSPKYGTFYDGTAGIGKTLLKAFQFNNAVSIYGQEIVRDIYGLLQINSMAHGIKKEDGYFALGDTLSNPKFINENGLIQFDYIAMNAPFGGTWEREKAERDIYGRFTRYGIPSKSHGDMAFVLHAVASLKESGKAAMIVPHGVLFRGAADQGIREALIHEDLIEAVIALPSSLFLGTGIPVVILLLNKNKDEQKRGKVQFILAEDNYGSTRTQKYLRTEDINNIISLYEEFQNNDVDSRIVNMDEIKEENYVLNPKVYFPQYELSTLIGTVIVNKNEYENSVEDKVKLGDIAKVFRGVNLPSKSAIKANEGKGYKVIQLKDIEDGKIQFNKLDRLPVQNIERYTVQSGDIIISSRGTALKIAVVPDNVEEVVLSNMFIGIRLLNKEEYNPHYIKAFLESPIGLYFLEAYQKGSVMRVITAKDVEVIELPKKDIQEQNLLVKEINATEQEYKMLLEKAERLYKDGYINIYEKMGVGKSISLMEK